MPGFGLSGFGLLHDAVGQPTDRGGDGGGDETSGDAVSAVLGDATDEGRDRMALSSARGGSPVGRLLVD